MNKVIWKIPLNIAPVQTMFIPEGAEILRVEAIDDVPYLWALVDPDGFTETTMIHILATGEPIPYELGDYIGSYRVLDGREIYHVFKGE